MFKVLSVDSIEKDFECVAAEFPNCILVMTYRSPSGCFKSFLTRLSNILIQLNNRQKNVIITGNFNIVILSQSNQLNEFKNLIKCFGFSFKISSPTRISNFSSTCMDNIITDMPNSLGHCIEPSFSDHLAQVLEFNNYKNKKRKETKYFVDLKRDLKPENILVLKTLLKNESWEEILNSFPDSYSIFYKIFKYFNRACPIYKGEVYTSTANRWITPGI